MFYQRTWYFQEQNSGKPTYKNTRFYKEGIVGNHKSFMSSMNITINEEYDDDFHVPTLYWIPNLHKNT